MQPAAPFAFALPAEWTQLARQEEAAQGWAAAERGFTELLWQAGEDGAPGDALEALQAREPEEDAGAEQPAVDATAGTSGGLTWEAAIRMIVAPSPQWGVRESAGGAACVACEGERAGEAPAVLPEARVKALRWACVQQETPAGESALEAEWVEEEAAAGSGTPGVGRERAPAEAAASGGSEVGAPDAALPHKQTSGQDGPRQGAPAALDAGPGEVRGEVRPEPARVAGLRNPDREEGGAVKPGLAERTPEVESQPAAGRTEVRAQPAVVANEAMAAGSSEPVARGARTAGPANRGVVQMVQGKGVEAAERGGSPEATTDDGGKEERRGPAAPVEHERRERGAAGHVPEAAPVAAGQTAMARSAEPGRAAVTAQPEGAYVQEHRRAEANGGEALPGAERLPMREITPVSTPLAPRTVQIQVLGERGEDVQATISATAGGGVQVRLRAASPELSQAIEQGAPLLRERLEQVHTPRAAEVWDAAAWSAEAGAGVRAASEGAGQSSAGQENAGQESASRDNDATGGGERGGRHSGGERRERHAEADGEEFEVYFQAGGRR
ncbi:MAG: hypothetical protein IPJ98_31575 [Bryobacterales bacterium]|nr:hypothetical protein [Bryobacterales bacterium]